MVLGKEITLLYCKLIVILRFAAMSLMTMPLLIINLGGEMLYILEQRLRVQNEPEKKIKKGNPPPSSSSSVLVFPRIPAHIKVWERNPLNHMEYFLPNSVPNFSQIFPFHTQIQYLSVSLYLFTQNITVKNPWEFSITPDCTVMSLLGVFTFSKCAQDLRNWLYLINVPETKQDTGGTSKGITLTT